jgi:phage terminase large subunit-like protein
MLTTTSSPVDLDARWRPDDRSGPTCGHTFRKKTCLKSGAHYCEPRADRVVLFFARMLVHIKGKLARRPFILEDWQEWEIIRPLFGEVIWDDENEAYARRYRIAWIVVARKNGKSELAAGIMLYMLVGDDEDSAEVYCAAKDKDQAKKVFDPAKRMVQLSPKLSQRLGYNKNENLLYDELSGSQYKVLTSDAEGELGHNPHAFNLDEVLSQPDGSMWTAMTTAAGTRLQELMLATTTETNDNSSFGAGAIDEAEKVQENPERAPHIFTFIRKLPLTDEQLEAIQRAFPGHPHLPVSTDPWDERNWKWPNPALDQFKSRASMRRQALDAKNDPTLENGFKQFQVNQRVSQAHRWMPMLLFNANVTHDLWLNPTYGRKQLLGRPAWGGLDLAAKFDLTAWCLLVPDDDQLVHAIWRFWLPESAVEALDKHDDGKKAGKKTGGKQNEGKWARWAKQGWITVTEGDVVDYERIYDDIEQDGRDFDLVATDADQWSSAPVIQEIEKRLGVWEIDAYQNTYQHLSPGMTELMALVKKKRFRWHGNPIAKQCFDDVEVRKSTMNPDLIRPDKPERDKTGKRIDAVPTAAMACNALTRAPLNQSNEDQDRKVVVSSRR